MKKPPPIKSKAKKKAFGTAKPEEVELEPGAWGKFEALIRRAAKMGHKPHTVAKKIGNAK